MRASSMLSIQTPLQLKKWRKYSRTHYRTNRQVLKCDQLIIVSDNGPNIVAALEGEAHLRCICHCLNLAVQGAFDESPERIKFIITAAKSYVEYYKHIGQPGVNITFEQQVSTR